MAQQQHSGSSAGYTPSAPAYTPSAIAYTPAAPAYEPTASGQGHAPTPADSPVPTPMAPRHPDTQAAREAATVYYPGDAQHAAAWQAYYAHQQQQQQQQAVDPHAAYYAAYYQQQQQQQQQQLPPSGPYAVNYGAAPWHHHQQHQHHQQQYQYQQQPPQHAPPPPSTAPSYAYPHQQQQEPSRPQHHHHQQPPSATASTAASAAAGDYSRVPPPPSLAAPPPNRLQQAAAVRPMYSARGQQQQPAAAAATGSNATPVGAVFGGAMQKLQQGAATAPAALAAPSGAAGSSSKALEAMRAAAAATAARMTAEARAAGLVRAGSSGGTPTAPLYVPVAGGKAAAAGPGPSSAAAAAAAAATAARQQQQQSAAGGAGVGSELPVSLQQYVARALALKGRTNEGRAELRTALRDMIADAKRAGTMWSTDWDRLPLPTLASEKRAGAAGAGAAAGAAAGGLLGSKRGRPSGAFSDSDDGYSSDDGGDGYGGGGTYSAPPAARRQRVDLLGGPTAAAGTSQTPGGNNKPLSKKAARKQQHQQLQLLQQQQRELRAAIKKQERERSKAAARGVAGLSMLTPEDAAKQAARSARFASHQHKQGPSPYGGASASKSGPPVPRSLAALRAAYGWADDAADNDDALYFAPGEFVVGTCAALEKRYFRLTRAPLPEEVRPQPVLEQALARLLRLIETKAEKYLYLNDQFKALRQDLTVQGIKNAFAVQVYEAHARAALEYGDPAEYNQCQTQLAILYLKGLPGCHAEFAAYRLLYQSVHAAAGEGRRLLGTLRQLLGGKVGAGVASSPEVQHAMQVRQALSSGSVPRFFDLYVRAPRLGRCLMDVAVKGLRWRALNVLVRAHKPGPLPLPYLAANLGFVLRKQEEQEEGQGEQPPPLSSSASPPPPHPNDLPVLLAAPTTAPDTGRLLPGCAERECHGENAPATRAEVGLAACLAWCKEHGALFDDGGGPADLAACSLLTKDCWSQLFVPEDTSKVAHGDANLDITDFLASF